MSAQANETFRIGQGKETRDVITPFAFSVSDELIGVPLASPIRRGIALLIDLFLVALLTNVSSMFLAGLVAIMFFRAGNRLKQKKRFNGLRVFLRAMAAMLLFVFALGIFDYAQDSDGSNDYYSVEDSAYFDGNELTPRNEDKVLSGQDALKFAGFTAKYVGQAIGINGQIENGTCLEPSKCWEQMLTPLAKDLATLEMPANEAYALFDAVLSETQESTDAEQLEALKNQMIQTYNENLPPGATGDNNAEQTKVGFEDVEAPAKESVTSSTPDEDKLYSVLEWAKGIASDLGIGFGWAAFYFTASMGWFKGYTPGKKLLGIKTIKLDGKALNLWESFERYGGYGAGLATGLLGFLQIFWDPNRQAIQDKISETLVIDTRKPRVKVEVISDGESPEATTGQMVSAER